MGAPPSIPNKPYFKIGEVAKLAGVEPYVLRYWETEFKAALRPEKTRTNQRMYRRRDVEAVLQIKMLLYEQGYRIDGAKRRLRELADVAGANRAEPPVSDGALRVVENVRAALDELDKIIDEDERS